MRRSRFTETQIVAILQEAEAGKKTREICRQHGISDATYDHGKSKYGGMSASELKRLKEIEGIRSLNTSDEPEIACMRNFWPGRTTP